MKRNYSGIAGTLVNGSSGSLGILDDGYLDPLTWRIRYMTMRMGNWLLENDIIAAVRNIIIQDDGVFSLAFEKEQVAASSLVPTGHDMAIPSWLEVGRIKRTESPFHALPPHIPSSYATAPSSPAAGLLSVKWIIGHQIRWHNRRFGRIQDMIIELDTWQVTGLVVETNGLDEGERAEVPVENITISNGWSPNLIINDPDTMVQKRETA